MLYESLDDDTRNIIDSMVISTGSTKQQVIGNLVEFGMVSMIASATPGKESELFQRILDPIRKDEKLVAAARTFKRSWTL